MSLSPRPLAAAALLSLSLLTGACGRIVGSGSGRPPQNTAISLIAGGVANVDPGTAGYIITANAGSFRFTWSGYAEFRGSLFADPSAFGRLVPGCVDNTCTLASGEDVVRVSTEPGRIDFLSFPASGKRSGFDVEITSNLVFVDLLVDGRRRPELTLFAGVDDSGRPFQATAATMPIGLQVALPTAAPSWPSSPSQVPAPPAARDFPGTAAAAGEIKVVGAGSRGAAALAADALEAYQGGGSDDSRANE